MPTEQLQFPFASLDFPGRISIRTTEMATKLGTSSQHIVDLITEGKIIALDVRGRGAANPCYRIPVESYRDYVCRCITSPVDRLKLLKDLPRATLIEFQRELKQLLAS